MCQLKQSGSGGGGFTRQVTTTINGRSTELVWHSFSNKGFLLVTQYAKIPNLYGVRFDLTPLERPVTADVTDCGARYVSMLVTMTCLLGPDKDETRSAIQYLINRTKLQSSPHDLVVAVGLKECNGVILAELAAALNAIL